MTLSTRNRAGLVANLLGYAPRVQARVRQTMERSGNRVLTAARERSPVATGASDAGRSQTRRQVRVSHYGHAPLLPVFGNLSTSSFENSEVPDVSPHSDRCDELVTISTRHEPTSVSGTAVPGESSTATSFGLLTRIIFGG